MPRSGTNDQSRDNRFGDGGPPRRFPDNNEPPNRSRDATDIPERMTQKIRQATEVTRRFDETAPQGFYFGVWFRAFNNTRELQSSNAPTNIALPERDGTDTSTHARTRANFREVWQYTEMGDGVLVGKSVLAELKATQQFALWLVLGGVAVLLLGVTGIWLLAGQALKPVQAISAAATRISAGNLAERINVSATDNELGDLAKTLNSTFARLEASFAQQKQFTADASHELRTPLAVLISEAQTTLARPRSETEYRETIETCLATAQQMRKLTEALLELARYDSGIESMTCAPVDLAGIAADVAKLVRPLATERQLEIITELASAPTLGAADRLSQVITNLLSNAIEYSKPGGKIRVTTRVQDKEVFLTVQDEGAGIGPDDLPHIFKRFHRADKSRSRANGHSGLGLSICQSIVEAHGGEIAVASQLGEGSTFTICLPTA
ncbi:MAG: ATP-binding protein [Verrucomicrobiota bacterium]